MEAQAQATKQVYIGIDVGGTNNKIAILSVKVLNIEATNHMQVTIGNQTYNLYTYSTFSIQSFLDYLRSLKDQLNNIRVVATGGGAVQYAKQMSQLFQMQVPPISQFEAHGRGLQFYKEAGLQLRCVRVEREQNLQMCIKQVELSLKQCTDLLFVSLGSGVNYQLYGQTEKGIERKPAKDKLLTAGDGYFLEGTSLGAGFLMGVGRLWTEKHSFSELLSLMKQEGQLKQFYEAILINLFLIAINVALLHDQSFVFITGALLSYDLDLSTFFKKAVQYLPKPKVLKLSVMRLERLEGYLGALGALKTAIE